MAIDLIDNLVEHVDYLDGQINSATSSILQGVPLTLEEINMFIEKIAERALLNHELERVREERNRGLRDLVNQNP